MLKEILVVFSLVFVCCNAADPVRPNIPATFFAEGHVELHRDEQVEFGRGSWCSDESKISIARNTTVEQDGRPRGHFYTLELFEKHIEYHERPTRDGKGEDCSHEPLRGEFVAPFEWVKQAKYNGTETTEHKTVHVWYFRVGPTELEVGIDADSGSDPNVPYMFIERSHMGKVVMIFEKFSSTTVPSCDIIPRNCI